MFQEHYQNTFVSDCKKLDKPFCVGTTLLRKSITYAVSIYRTKFRTTKDNQDRLFSKFYQLYVLLLEVYHTVHFILKTNKKTPQF